MAFSRPAHLVFLSAALSASAGVGAVGFGRIVPTAVLGQPLQVQIPVRLDQGEQLFAECVQAEVIAGEGQLPSSQVRVSVQATAQPNEWLLRVMTTSPILEPVVEITVSAGCERRFIRRFTALADPPAMPLSAPVAQAVVQERPLQTQAPRPSAAAPVREPRAASAPPQARAASDTAVVRRQAPRTPAPVAAAKAPVNAAPAAREAQVSRLLLDVGVGPRLRMDLDEPVFMPAEAVAAAASGAEGGESVDQLLALQKSLDSLKKETSAYRQNEQALRARLAEAESRSRLVPWLLGLIALGGGLAGWWAWRQRRPAAAVDRTDSLLAPDPAATPWWGPSEERAASDAQSPSPPSQAAAAVEDWFSSSPAPGAASEVPGVLVQDIAAPTAYERTRPITSEDRQAMAAASIVDGQLPPREVSVEELLDLEQQADFFIALGQEDAAVDLLMSHLRSSGGQSPLPYTKLLEIYRRQGDRAAYERIRARFNRRFNAYAPDWDHGPQHGRSLEEYPEVTERLQGLWSSPLNAMAVLEAMLFRNDDQQELFDLPAYKDVLLLYSLARDLYQQSGVTAEDVDLLLPLGDEAAFMPSGTGAAVVDEPPGLGAYDLTAFTLDIPAPPDGGTGRDASKG